MSRDQQDSHVLDDGTPDMIDNMSGRRLEKKQSKPLFRRMVMTMRRIYPDPGIAEEQATS